MDIKLNLDVSEATEKLNRVEDQIDRILEKQKQIGNIKGGQSVTRVLHHMVMKEGQLVDAEGVDIARLAEELTFYIKHYKIG